MAEVKVMKVDDTTASVEVSRIETQTLTIQQMKAKKEFLTKELALVDTMIAEAIKAGVKE